MIEDCVYFLNIVGNHFADEADGGHVDFGLGVWRAYGDGDHLSHGRNLVEERPCFISGNFVFFESLGVHLAMDLRPVVPWRQSSFTAQRGVSLKPNIKKQLKAFGENLSRERTSHGLTQEKLAEMAELNVRTVQKIEAGETNILITTAYRLRRAIGCPWGKLMEIE